MIYVRKNFLFILYVFSFVCSGYFFAENSVSVQIPRITDELVDERIPAVEKLLKQSDIIRKVIFYGGAAVAIGGAAHIFYSWFLAQPTVFPSSDFGSALKKVAESGKLPDAFKQVGDGVAACTKEIDGLKAQVQTCWRLKEWLKGSIFSKAGSFIKFAINSIATSVVLSQITNAQRYCKSVFKERDLKWYIGMHTHLGTFMTFDDIGGNPRERFDNGQLFQEFKSMAQLLERDLSSSNCDSDKLVSVVQSISKDVMKEVTQVLAYMKYTATNVFSKTELDETTISQKQSEALSYCYYVSSYFNECADAIEKLLQKKMNNSLQKGEAINTIQKFINDFKVSVIGFNRIQQNIHAIV